MENENIKKGKKYLVIGIIFLSLAILGTSVAYYLVRVQGTLNGRAAGTGLDLTITPLSTSATGDLIPLDNDIETLTTATLGYGNSTTEFDSTKSCIDINGTVTFTSIQGDQIKGRFKQESEAEITLKSLGLTVDTEHIPNFSITSGNNGVKYNLLTDKVIEENQGDGTNGIYEAEDDLGTTYYFRGAVQNNYVKFGGVLWRIVRINGDGTIRITLNQSIGKIEYNEDFDDNAYVGYMYGSLGSSSYADTHANTNNSTIKTYLDTWYTANLLQYEDKIADAIYCNDRTVVNFAYNDQYVETTFSGTGAGTEETAYTGLKRNFVDHTPSLRCMNNNDKFTMTDSLGNGDLIHPIGLLSLDEYSMAGAGTVDNNTGEGYIYVDGTGAFYLYDFNDDFAYWTMTPIYMIDHHGARVGIFIYNGSNYYNWVYGTDSDATSVRPVVSLKSSSITSGSGTSADPFVVGGTNDSAICLNGAGC